VPYASLPPSFKYCDFFDDRNLGDQATAHEKLVWELASVLFDIIDVPSDLQTVPAASNLLRKDNVSAFWQKLVGEASNRYVAMAKSSEEKAIACLSGHRVSEACGHLLNGKNFHLATLVALMGGNERMKKNIREQLNEWQKSKVLSEFSQPIRAIYELLAGNVCVCDGTKGAPIEDRIESFIISKRFGLDWRQAFGLRLWYAIQSSDDIARAVELFAEDLEQDKETAKPQAWYVEQGISPLWNDYALDSREDLLWGLLKLYANSNTDLESVLRPENSQLSPLNVRLSWQLSRALVASGKASYGDNGDEKADQLTLSFAAQLTNEGNWVDATFVLLHLSTASVRAKAILDHLAHHAGRIGPEDGQTFVTLVQDLHIPRTWVWEAKALYMRSVQKDPRGEVECLLRAGAYVEAHRTFSREVAPTTVIERDWDTLRALLAGFKGQEVSIAEWHLGGELYVDYLHLIEAQRKGTGKIDEMVLERLLAALPAMAEDGRHASFLETVAVQEISGVVAQMVVEMGKQGNASGLSFLQKASMTNGSQNKDLSRVLRLPLTEDKYLKHTADLSLGYFKGIMAGGR
jgi:nuclear pore complex protein Nup98-Nup96